MDEREPHTAEVLVERGYQALRAGDRRRARHYFTTAIASDPTCVTAWEGLARLTTDPHLALEYLHQARSLLVARPGGEDEVRLRQTLQRVQSQIQQIETARRATPRTLPDLAPVPLRPYPSRWRWVVLGLLLLVLLVLIAVAALNLAPAISARGLWPGETLTIALQSQRMEADPASSGVASPATSRVNRLVAGRAALVAEDWPRAVALLTAAHRSDPADPVVTALLSQCYLDWGRWRVAQGRYTVARRYFDQALALVPNNWEAMQSRQALSRDRRTPVPSQSPGPAQATAIPRQPGATPVTSSATTGSLLAGKWIDISLSRQTLTAYEGDRPVLQAVASTGTNRYPTPTGRFAIQRKYRYTHMSGPGYSLPNVPYAMFFYRGYAIHGTYWHNNFGTPMSHGCINMRTDQAGWLFNWAPVGTPVVIHN